MPGGIGREIARILAEEGHDLILTACSEDELRELARQLQAGFGVEARAIACGLSWLKMPGLSLGPWTWAGFVPGRAGVGAAISHRVRQTAAK